MILLLIILGCIGLFIGLCLIEMYLTSFVPEGSGVWLVRGFILTFVSSVLVVAGVRL